MHKPFHSLTAGPKSGLRGRGCVREGIWHKKLSNIKSYQSKSNMRIIKSARRAGPGLPARQTKDEKDTSHTTAARYSYFSIRAKSKYFSLTLNIINGTKLKFKSEIRTKFCIRAATE